MDPGMKEGVIWAGRKLHASLLVMGDEVNGPRDELMGLRRDTARVT